MYCSSCGKSINPDLRYCNHCGARLNDDPGVGKMKIPQSSFNLMVIGLLGLPIAGIGVIIGLLSVMKKELGFGDEMIGIVAVMCISLLVLAELGLLWLLWSSTRTPKHTAERPNPNVLSAPDIVFKGLPESRIEPINNPVPSVTEHTTKTLDAVPIQQK